MNMDNINLVTTDKTILSIYGGFTAIEAYVLPGQPFTIERLDEEAIDLYFKDQYPTHRFNARME